MIDLLGVAIVVHADAAGVVLQTLGVDIRGDRPALKDLRHDIHISLHRTIFADGYLKVGRHSSWLLSKIN